MENRKLRCLAYAQGSLGSISPPRSIQDHLQNTQLNAIYRPALLSFIQIQSFQSRKKKGYRGCTVGLEGQVQYTPSRDNGTRHPFDSAPLFQVSSGDLAAKLAKQASY